MDEQLPKPCGFNVLVRLDDVQKTSDGGIILNSIEYERIEQGGVSTGTILAFGPTCYKGFAGCDGPADWGVKIGDRVKFEKYVGVYVDFDADPRLVTVPDSTFKVVL